ncbi:retrotransposable element ORF2 protein [Plecturocebus cupreus]
MLSPGGESPQHGDRPRKSWSEERLSRCKREEFCGTGRSGEVLETGKSKIQLLTDLVSDGVSLLLPKVKCSGMIFTHCNLCLGGSIETGFHHVGQAGLKLLTSVDPPTLATKSIQPLLSMTITKQMGESKLREAKVFALVDTAGEQQSHSSDTIKRLNRQSIVWEKIFAHIYGKGLRSRIYEELLQINKKKTNYSIELWGKKLEQALHKRASLYGKKSYKNNQVLWPGVVAHASNSSTLGGRGRRFTGGQEFETSLANMVKPGLY